MPHNAHAFVLYLDTDSPVSWRAARNVIDTLEERQSIWSLEIRDLDHPTVHEVDPDESVFHPTLVRLEPSPECWLVGGISKSRFGFMFVE